MQRTLFLSTYHTCFYQFLLCNKPTKLSSLKWQPFFSPCIGHLSRAQQGRAINRQSMASLIYLAAGWVLPRAVSAAGPCLSSSSPAPAHAQGSGLKGRKRGGKPNAQALSKSVGHAYYCLIGQSKSYDQTHYIGGIYLRIANTVQPFLQIIYHAA